MSIIRFWLLGLLCVLTKNLSAQLTVNFTASQTEGCGFALVEFCDNSVSQSGTIVAWSWDIAGLNSSNECQGRLFSSPGSYDVCLMVTDSEGNTATHCKQNFITIHALPLPDFVATPNEGCAPLTSTFTYTGTPNIDEYIWGIGGSTGVYTSDGSSSPDAISTYEFPDEYSISLTVKDNNGCVNFVNKQNYIKSYAPTEVMISTPDTFACQASHFVQFENENIQPNMVYSWDFGNGETFVGDVPPPIEYEINGDYTVTVIGFNTATLCSDTLVLENYIKVGFPVVLAFSPWYGCAEFDASFIDISGLPADSVFWDFDDGTPLVTEANPCHLFENPGIYNVSLTRYINGCANTGYGIFPVEVFARSEVEMFSADTIACSLPYSASFEGISSDPDIQTWYWDFGDGNTSNQKSPTHIYNEYGIFPVTLTITNSNGCESTISDLTVRIKELEALIPEGVISGCAPLEVTLEDNSYSINPIISKQWEVNLPSGQLLSNDSIANFIIPDTGCFDVILTVTNILGCVDVDTFENAICVGTPPDISFEASPQSTCVSDTVFFTDLSSGNIDSWYWHFSNGTASGDQHPTSNFNQVGYYPIYLEVGYNGCFSDTTASNYIQVAAPKSYFEIIESCSDPTYKVFNNFSIGADSVYWDFGVSGMTTDTSTLFSPTFTYPDTGVYVVTLKSFNFGTGCEHSLSQALKVIPTSADFTISSNELCDQMTIVANCPFEAVKYKWSGSNMTFSNDSIAKPEITFDTSGIYTDLKLIVEDANGCIDSITYPDPIYVNEVQANYTFDLFGNCDQLEATFKDSSLNLFASNTQWNWYLDSNLYLGTGSPLTYVFPNDSVYEITLRVVDDWGCEATMTDSIEIIKAVAMFELDSIGCTTSTIEIKNLSKGIGLSYFWDFGDGNTSTESMPSHQYQQEGSYYPCVTITDQYGCMDTYCYTAGVQIANPFSNFTMDNNFETCPPMFVNFQNQSSNVISYKWDFGDASGSSTIESPTHIYTQPGNYDVTLIAFSPSSNCIDTFVIENAIELHGPTGDFYFEVDTSCVPLDVTFYTEDIDATELTWDFGDGSPLDSNVVLGNNGEHTYTYNSIGYYVPRLAISDGTGCVRVIEKPDTILSTDLNVEIIASNNIICTDTESIEFSAVAGLTEFIDSYYWIFSGVNPDISTLSNPNVTYGGIGSYDVSLIASNEFCADTVLKKDFINVGERPTVDFETSIISGCAPLSVDFNDLSSIGIGSIGEIYWNFGDSTFSNLSNPNHTFDAGTYSVNLMVYSDIGCMDSVSKEIIVHPLPEVELTGSDILCFSDSTQIIANISGSLNGMTFYWESDPTLSCTNCLDPFVSPTDKTTYTFVAINSEGCETISQIEINVGIYETPTLELNTDTTICINESVQLFVGSNSNIATFEWENTPGLSCYNCSDPLATPLVSSTYTVTITSIDGCTNSGSIEISVLDQQTDFVTDRTICSGDSVQLEIMMGNNPILENGTTLSCNNCFYTNSFSCVNYHLSYPSYN